MPRLARFVYPGVPFHVTQRGNRRGSVFFNDYDRESYLTGLLTYATRHAQRINRLKGWSGHLWQGRYFAAALDEPYLWAAIRYVELNPVTAKLTARAEDYPWSSAAAHCGLRSDPVLTQLPYWNQLFRGVGNWAAWLGRGENPEERLLLRRNTVQGLPCGSPQFVARLTEIAGSTLQVRSRGRPRKSNG